MPMLPIIPFNQTDLKHLRAVIRMRYMALDIGARALRAPPPVSPLLLPPNVLSVIGGLRRPSRDTKVEPMRRQSIMNPMA